MGAWAEADFEEAKLEVSDGGVRADAVFTDTEGRGIEVRVDDRDGRRRRRGALLAPVSDGIANRAIPASGVVECPLPDGATARLAFDPTPPDVNALPHGAEDRGIWSASADGIELAAGEWFAARARERIAAGLDVTTGWTARGLPLLMRIVTTVAPVFRRWPTTYRWRADLGPEGVTSAGWERTGSAGAGDYRRATGT